MNNKLYRLVFSRSRGALVAAAECVAASGKSAAGESTRGTALALAASALVAGPAFGQTLPSNASIQQGAASVSVSGANMVVKQTTPRMVADWQSFSIGAANSVQFVQPSSSAVALNRVTGNQASAIFGSLTANGHVYLQNPAGVLFAPGSQVNVGALVATTLQADPAAFMAGQLRLSGGEASRGAVVNQGSITTPSGGHVVLAGPQVGNAGSISTPLGTTALAAGNAVNVDPTGSGLISISVPVAAIDARLTQTGAISADGGSVALHAAATDAALRSVMQVGGVVRARSIEQRDGQIVLAGGASGVVAVTGTLDASGGANQAGGSVKVLGERVALLGNARLDASGDAGGGTVLVGGNWQGKGPEANATDTFVGGGVVLDASARTRGDGGKVVVWSDHTTTFKGRIDATGGAESGDGGTAEVSGKQLLRFGGGVNLKAARGKTGTLLLDPNSIELVADGLADIDGNLTTGDDIMDSVSPDAFGNYIIFSGDFAGAASRITSSQVASLLFTSQVTLQATSSITVSAPVTVAPGGATSTLDLNAPSVAINAALDLNNTYLNIDTQLSGSDSIRINAPVRTNNVVNLTSSDIGIPSIITADTIYLNANGAGQINSNGALQANHVIVGRNEGATSAVALTGSNIIGNLYIDADSANIRISQPFYNGNGTYLRPSTVTGNFTLNVSGISLYQYSFESVTVGGLFNLTLTDPRSDFLRVELLSSGNSFGSVVFNVAGDLSLNSASALPIRGTAARNITLTSDGLLTLTGNISSTDIFNPSTIDITSVGFNNAINASLIVQSGGSFTLDSSDYLADVLGTNIAFGPGLADINNVIFAGNTASLTQGGNVFFTNQSGALLAPQSDLPAISRPYNTGTGFGFGYSGSAADGSFSDNLQEVAARILNDGPGGYTAFGSGNFTGNNSNSAAETNKGFTTNPITNTELYGSSGARYLGLTIAPFIRAPGVSATNPVSEITPLARTITGIVAANKVYDATTVATLTGTPGIVTLGSDVVTVGGTVSASFADKNVGNTKPVTVTGYSLGGADAGNYSLASQPTGLTANITPAPLAVTGITASNKVYDTFTTATLTGSGAVTPLLSDVVTLGGTGSGNFANKNVGANKPVTVTGFTLGGNDAGNYQVQQPAGVLANITQANLAISGIVAANKAYDATTVATLVGTPAATPLAGDTVILSGTGSASFASKTVGNAKPVTVTGYTLGGADAGNYALGAPPGLVANITPINLAVTGISALDKTYDATTFATLTGSASVAPIAGDVVAATGTGVGTFNTKNVGTAKPVSVTGFSLAGADAGNYTIVQPAGASASIVQASLTVAGITAANKVYDTTTVASLTGTAVAVPLGSDAVAISGSGTGAFVDKNVGVNKLVVVNGYTLSGADAGNYTLGQPTGLTASISAAPLAIGGFSVADKVYDATTVATLTGSASVTPLPGDTVTVGGAGTGAFADKNVGVGKSVVVSGFALAGADAGNYSIAALSPSSASITARPLAVTGVGAANKVYDASTSAALTGTPSIAALTGDAIALGGSGVGTFANKNVGVAKPVAVSGYALVGSDAGNYTLAQPAGITASISAASLSVSGVSAADKVYDTTTVATLTGSPVALPLGSDVVTLGGSGVGVFADKNVGVNKPVAIAGYTLGGADAGNYILGQPAGLFADITRASLVITGFSVADKVYDATTTASLTGSATASALPGDIVTVSGLGSGAFADKNVGVAKPVVLSGFTLGGADAGNYTVAALAPSSASITPRPLAVAGIGAAGKVYDATTAATLTGSASIAPLPGDAIALGGSGVGTFANKNVGVAKPVAISGYALVGSDAGNYTLVQPAAVTASISPATLTVSGVSAADKVYDTTTVATLSGTPSVAALGSDVVGVSAGAGGSFSDKNVGLDKPVSLGSFTLTGADAGNYTLVAPTGLVADITPRVLAPTGISAVNRGADPTTTNVALDTSGAALPGVLVGDTVTLDASSAIGSVSSADAGRNKTVAVSGLALSGPDARNYALSVGANGLANSTPLVLGITVTLFSPLQQVFEDLRDKEYLQGVSDAQEPFRRAMAEALAAGFGKENIRKQLQRGLVFETGLAAPAVDTIEPARKPASCTPARGVDASPLSCNP